jgi:hypothetical protein
MTPVSFAAFPVLIVKSPDGPAELVELTSGVSSTRRPDVEDALDPEAMFMLPPMPSEVECPAAK